VEEDTEREMTVRQASQHSGFSGSYLLRLIDRGKIRGRRLGSFWIVDKPSLDAYLATERKPGKKRQPAKANA
jgi:excisionase family DNA binding protein